MPKPKKSTLTIYAGSPPEAGEEPDESKKLHGPVEVDDVTQFKSFPKPEKKKKVPQPLRSRKPINKVSARREIEKAIYDERRPEFLKGKKCQAGVECNCDVPATEVHHKSGRIGTAYLDEADWLAMCSPCHKYVTEYPAGAKLLGLSKDRNRVG